MPYDVGLWVALLEAAGTAGLGAVGERWEEIVVVLGNGREASVPPSVMAAHRRIKAVAAVQHLGEELWRWQRETRSPHE
jgi:hypothetical protein